MALKLEFIDPMKNTADYIEISEYNQCFQTQTGSCVFRMWKNEDAKTTNWAPVDECSIPMRNMTANKIDSDGCIIAVKFDTFKDKTEAQLYTLAKNVKIRKATS